MTSECDWKYNWQIKSQKAFVKERQACCSINDDREKIEQSNDSWELKKNEIVRNIKKTRLVFNGEKKLLKIKYQQNDVYF